MSDRLTNDETNDTVILSGTMFRQMVQREERQKKRIFRLESALLKIGTWSSLFTLTSLRKTAMEALKQNEYPSDK